MKKCIIFILIIKFFALAKGLSENLVVKLPVGSVKGYQKVSPGHKKFWAFEGIPYGKAPVGSLRFQAPLPANSWNGTRDATKAGRSCYANQKDYPNDGEDCLNLSVYCPLFTNNSTNHVMVYFYGGGFRGGSWGTSVYGPDFLVEQGVIVVGLNYRTGPFGFLSTGDTVIPGNAGLKDQVLALKWVQKNIKYFGGNPSKVTIFGQSAGGASVGLQIVSPLSKGLFQGAIAESGSAVSVWAYLPNPKTYAEELVTKVDSSKKLTDSHQIMQFLQSVPAKQLHEAASQKLPIDHPLPVIEPEHNGAFITKSMYELLQKGDFNRVPLMIGGNSEEYISLATDMNNLRSRMASLDSSLQKLVPTSFHVTDRTELNTIGQQIKNLYIKDGTNFSTHLGLGIAYTSESHFFNPCVKHAELQSKYTNVYFYKFSYAGKWGENINIVVPEAEKCTHGEENYYIFRRKHGTYDNSDASKFPAADVLTHQRMVALWVNFALHFNPTPEKDKLLQNLIWPTVQPGNVQYMNVDTNLKIENHIKSGRYEGWSKIFDKYAKSPITF